MEEITATRLISNPDGSQSLLLRRARLLVTSGPDRGQHLDVVESRALVGTGVECDLRLGDAAVSRHHLELRVTEHGYLVKDLGSTNGTFVGNVRLGQVLVNASTSLRLGETVLALVPSESTVEIPLSSRGSFGGLLGQSIPMRQVFAALERVAGTDSTVLLEGESGTGKEVAAEAIHAASSRASRPFVVVDCGAIAPTLMESELFGHEQGAFTGATHARQGALEQADGGTVFLDEIGEVPLELQPRLLRFLESQEVRRLGSAVHHRVDVRILAATNRRLKGEVAERRFREDLYYRLAVICLRLPPLRERPEDIRLLALHFAERFARDPYDVITDQISGLLLSYPWPGNVRELRNVVERLVVAPEQALQSLVGAAAEHPASGVQQYLHLPFHEGRRRWQDLFEREYLRHQLERAEGVVLHAASEAQLPRPSFHRLMRKHGLKGAGGRGGGAEEE
jgi:transcriptional regulator with GAF, ATPase, and Fis domain